MEVTSCTQEPRGTERSLRSHSLAPQLRIHLLETRNKQKMFRLKFKNSRKNQWLDFFDGNKIIHREI